MENRFIKKREQLLKTELSRIVDVLRQYYHPEKILLFGSLASGTVHEWSDIDLVVIARTNRRGVDRLIEVGDICKNRVATHFLVYTPEEFERLIEDRTSFLVNEVMPKSKVLYP